MVRESIIFFESCINLVLRVSKYDIMFDGLGGSSSELYGWMVKD